MNTRLIYSVWSILLLLCLSCSSDEESISNTTKSINFQTEILSKSDLDSRIISSVQSGIPWDWNQQPLIHLYSGLIYSENLLSVGISENWSIHSQTILNRVSQIEGRSVSDILLNSYDILLNSYVEYDFVVLKIHCFESLEYLKFQTKITYLELHNYSLNIEDSNVVNSFQSANSTSEELLDWIQTTAIPESFCFHNISNAREFSQGESVGIAVISIDETIFNYTDSFLNIINKQPNDAINYYGIAPRSTVYHYPINVENRGFKNKILNLLSVLTEVQSTESIRIIVLPKISFFRIRSIESELKKINNDGYLLITKNVGLDENLSEIFPSNLPFMVKIRVWDNTEIPSNSNSILQTNFSVYFGNFNGNDEEWNILKPTLSTYVFAGIIALVWSRYYYWSKTQVLNRVRLSSNLYPNPSKFLGYGFTDARRAVNYP